MFRYPVTSDKNLILRDFNRIGWYKLIPLDDARTILTSIPYHYGLHLAGYYLQHGKLYPLEQPTLHYEILMPRNSVPAPQPEPRIQTKRLDQLVFEW